ncbi:hypothetical protein BGX30_014345 [Mortierella sp. GBA39]|nr:hypothetical protein BGX30_014345 [Mortierella sp. GBA39]
MKDTSFQLKDESRFCKLYNRFNEALCNYGLAPNGVRILKPDTVDAMRSNRLSRTAQQDFAKFGGGSKRGYSYGLGVRTLVNPEDNNALSQHGEFGWDGARGCYVVMDPESEVTLFYAQQEQGSEWYRWHGTIRNYAYASIWDAEMPPTQYKSRLEQVDANPKDKTNRRANQAAIDRPPGQLKTDTGTNDGKRRAKRCSSADQRNSVRVVDTVKQSPLRFAIR